MNSSLKGGGFAVDMLGTVAGGLGLDSREHGRRALEVVRASSPELAALGEETGEDLVTTSAGFIEMLLTSLRSDVELAWPEIEQRSRDYGRHRASQGLSLESLIDVLAVYRRATIELLSQRIEGMLGYDEIIALAQSRLQDVTERLTTVIARGYLDHVDEEHRTRENEMHGLAAIVSAMGRSLDVNETAAVALVEILVALRLGTGAVWLRDRGSYKLVHTVGLDRDRVDEFAREVGPRVKASASAIGRAESQVDLVSGREWNGVRAQLKVRRRTVGMMTLGTAGNRLFAASDLLFAAAAADQVAIAIDRARQFASEARTDHLTGLANRREFERVIEREVALAQRHGRRVLVMLIDLDNLKRLNDRLGHSAGDAALTLVGHQLLRVVRASDVCARVGGDEFAVAMPETDLDRARDVVVRLRQAVDEASLALKAAERVEVSVGISAWRNGQDWQTVYKAADTDLYRDKRRRKAVRRSRQVSASENAATRRAPAPAP